MGEKTSHIHRIGSYYWKWKGNIHIS